MHHEAGVRVVVAGGRPTTGPMQAPSGTRGARLYDHDTLDNNIGFVQKLLTIQTLPDADFLPNRTEAPDVYVTYASINIRDQIRRDETVPIQFASEAADCLILYTPQTAYNYTALWQYAADAIWTNPSLCVASSTGYATTGTNKTDFIGPGTGTSGMISDLTARLSASSLTFIDDGLLDSGAIPCKVFNSKPCNSASDCYNNKWSCESVTLCQAGKPQPSLQCVPKCYVALAPCINGGRCMLTNAAQGAAVGNQPLREGYCPPPAAAQKCGVSVVGSINPGTAPASKRG